MTSPSQLDWVELVPEEISHHGHPSKYIEAFAKHIHYIQEDIWQSIVASNRRHKEQTDEHHRFKKLDEGEPETTRS